MSAPTETSLAELMKQIVEKHHAYCRAELGRLDPLLNAVIRKHGNTHPELQQIRSLFLKMGNDLKQHLLKEEQTLFPMISRMEEARNHRAELPKLPFGTIARPIQMMLIEHETGDREIEEIRKLSSEYEIPADADEDYSSLLAGLRTFEEDMKQHVFLENERLFPRAIDLEKDSSAGAAPESNAVR